MQSFPLEMKFLKGIGRPKICLKLSCVNIVFFPFARLHVQQKNVLCRRNAYLLCFVLGWSSGVSGRDNLVICQVMLPAPS